MAARHKVFTPNTILKAQEVNDISNNGVIKVATFVDLDAPDLVDANLAYVDDEHSLRMRITPGVGKANWSAPFSSRRRQQGVSHTGVGAWQVDNHDPARVYVLSNGNTVSPTGAFTGSGSFTLTVSAGPTLLTTYTMLTKALAYQTVSWTTSRDCSYGARAEQYQSGTNSVTHVGDPCVGGQCPPGWRCEDRGLVGGNRCVTTTNDPVYSTRYHCDNGGSLSGTTCIKTCTDSHSRQDLVNEPGYTNSDGEWWQVTAA